MAIQAAISMDTLKNNVLGLSSMRRTEIKRIIYSSLAAVVRRSLPLAKSFTKKIVRTYRSSMTL